MRFWLKERGFGFFVGLEYENIHEFCGFCKLVGHDTSVCRKAKKMETTLKVNAPLIADEGVLPNKQNIKKNL